MSKSDAVDTIERLYSQVLDSRLLEDPVLAGRVVEFFDPEVEIQQMSSMMGTAGTFRGYRGLAEVTREVLEAFSTVTFVPEEIKKFGDRVAVSVLARGTGKRSGVPAENRVGHLFAFREGRVVYWEVFDEPSEAFRAAEVA